MEIAKTVVGEAPFLRSDWRLDALAAALFGAVPVIGVVFWGWSPFALLLLFWVENLMIGVRYAVSMPIAGIAQHGLADLIGAAALTAFFCVHYGMFCLGHGAFLISMFSEADPAYSVFRIDSALFDLVDNDNFFIGVAAMAAWQAIQLALFITRGEFRRVRLQTMMGEPYGRIILLHLTIIFGGMAVMALGWPPAGVIFLAVLKLAGDVSAIWAARRQSKARAA
ncbi:MAG: hypothetical protein GC189_12815 [Alphaproteobacteria bacterium]|nr:hypothetical protein [Alphaproteobacteria bacterium]